MTTLSNGEKFNSPKPLKKNIKKLAKFQRKLFQKTLGSKRQEKTKLRVAKLYTIIDIRTDFLHI
ncbi:transposase [Dapis sp. BLCC M229]|uniref:transposase n=1 Tax=Dapis sp. BLCC M229 TaxID=3400188 RepID=UPI003CEE1F9C